MQCTCKQQMTKCTKQEPKMRPTPLMSMTGLKSEHSCTLRHDDEVMLQADTTKKKLPNKNDNAPHLNSTNGASAFRKGQPGPKILGRGSLWADVTLVLLDH
jgi:hypothetical protein